MTRNTIIEDWAHSLAAGLNGLTVKPIEQDRLNIRCYAV